MSEEKKSFIGVDLACSHSSKWIDFLSSSNDLKIHNTLNVEPTSNDTITFNISNYDSSDNIVHTETTTYNSITDRFNDNIQNISTDNIQFQSNIIDKYNNLTTIDQTQNKFKFWLKGQIEEIKVKNQANPIHKGGKY